jgi:hypothetical protein
MSVGVTRDQPSSIDGPVFELWNYCPYLPCGERTNVDPGSRFCGQCGSVFNICPVCRSTNRLLAGFCRACGKRLENEVWPMYPGLRAFGPSPGLIRSLGEVQPPYPLNLDAEVLIAPIACDGLVIITLNDGRIVFLSETTGQIVGRLSLSEPVALTPAFHAGSLFVASGAELKAFDLIEYFDQSIRQEASALWKVQFDEAITQPLVIDDQAIFVCVRQGEKAMIVAVSQANGKFLWAEPFQLDSYQITPVVMAAGYLIAITLGGEVSLIDPTTGQLRHTLTLGGSLDPQVSPYAMEDRVLWADTEGSVFEIVLGASEPYVNRVYAHGARIASLTASTEFIALGHTAGLTLLDPYGQLLWSNDSIESISQAPIIAGASVFALDDAGNGLLFNVLRSNPTIRHKLLTGWIGTPPAITHSKITCVSGDGKVVSIDWSKD